MQVGALDNDLFPNGERPVAPGDLQRGGPMLAGTDVAFGRHADFPSCRWARTTWHQGNAERHQIRRTTAKALPFSRQSMKSSSKTLDMRAFENLVGRLDATIRIDH